MSIPVLLLRLCIAFIILLILTRIMGRKEISQMTFFNFVSAISIGTIGASLAIDPSITFVNGVIALVGWTLITIIMGIIGINSKKANDAIVGDPMILIRKGEIMEDALRKARLDIGSLNALLRKKDVFAVSDVDYAIFETDGSLSVMKKQQKQTLTKGDISIPQSNTDINPITMAVVTDGEVNNENLKKLNLNEQWLTQQLNSAGIHSVSDVFYAEVQKDGSLYFDKRKDVLH
ncbi:MAG: YetF domain-containing protein [Heyndrickxia sp.]